ncbi:MAG: IS91 family transposase, partial [Candidatus Eisenbacteria bacterium]
MRAIEICRTAALGGHVDECDRCGALRISYSSCRNRHCPKCQSLAKERWLEDRKREILPTPYFHIVFTLPASLRPWAQGNQQVVYDILFKAASRTLSTLARDPKYLDAQIGFIAVLHTWTQTLIDHPHLHCIVTAGGLSKDGKQWISWRKGLFIPVKVLSVLFRGVFIDHLKRAHESGQLVVPEHIRLRDRDTALESLLADLYRQSWVVHCKAPMGRPEDVIDYLARYTHRVALSNDRLVRLRGDEVTFRWRDRARHNKARLMNLGADEFIRRFLLHVLPDGFVKIRYYGIFSHRNRKTKALRARRILGLKPESQADTISWQEQLRRLTGIDPRVCPHCGKGRMLVKEVVVKAPDGSILRLSADRFLSPGRPPP